METITRIGPAGPEWASDREVIKAHFKRRESQDKDVEDDGNHQPYILSLWHKEVKKDAIAHAAARVAREARMRRLSSEKKLPSTVASRRRSLKQEQAEKAALNTNQLVLEYQQQQEAAEAAAKERRLAILEAKFLKQMQAAREKEAALEAAVNALELSLIHI